MKYFSRWAAAGAICAALYLMPTAFPQEAKPGKWIKMFNGKNLDGWKTNENPEAWKAVDGTIVGDGAVSHLFWMKEECENCEFKAMVKISDGGNSGMYFRTAFGPGFPKGYEAQVNSSHKDPKRTGSLYNFKNVMEQLVPPDTWFTQDIIANGNHIIIKVNDKVAVDYVDEKNTYTKGYLALQQHNKGSIVTYKDLMFRKLPTGK
jgi:hypothetical protein